MKRTPKQTATYDVQTLRAEMDLRLAELEDALANPAKHASLESLILDLARVATEEADRTARQAVVDAQSAGQSAAAALRGEAASALEAEKTLAAGLRQAIDKAQAELQAALAVADTERRRAVGLEKAVEQARGELQAGRASIEAQQREIAAKLQEFAARHQGLDERFRALEDRFREEQAAHADARAQASAARVEADAERASAGRLLEKNVDLERNLDAVQDELTAVRRELEQARHDADARRDEADRLRRDAEASRGEADALRREVEASRAELEALRRDADTLRHDVESRARTQSQSHEEQAMALRAAEEAVRAADARTAEARRELDELTRELEEAKSGIRERDALRRELEIAHEERDAARATHQAGSILSVGDDGDVQDEETIVDLTTDTNDEEMQRAESRIRSLELALRDAETRAESAELELELQRQRRAPDRSDPIAVIVPASPPEPSKEPAFRGPARGAKRVPITTEVDIQVDAAPGKLVDLSMTGAQVLTSFSMKPNRLVKVTLPMGDSLIACKAKVMWSRLEPKAGQLWYRAGVSFTSADQMALEAFLNSHRRDV